jgi:hypothetical protein
MPLFITAALSMRSADRRCTSLAFIAAVISAPILSVSDMQWCVPSR